MTLGYDGKLYILAFDHRGSFQKKMFGIAGNPTPEDTDRIADAKHLIYEAMLLAADTSTLPADELGVLVDEQFGVPREIPGEARARGLNLAMPVEKSGQDTFDFEFGDQFGEHIDAFDVDFAKVLVRYNPEGDAQANAGQLVRLKQLSDWLHVHGCKFLFELLVPATAEQLAELEDEPDRYDAELRPELMRRAIQEVQDTGIEADVWKIEGVDDRADAQMLAAQTRSGGRDDVVCVLLGRGASDAKVDHWLRQAAPVDGFVGFAIGRSIWWNPLMSFLEHAVEREAAVQQIADNYLRFIRVYEEAEQGVAVA